jgi:hypothetical protein
LLAGYKLSFCLLEAPFPVSVPQIWIDIGCCLWMGRHFLYLIFLATEDQKSGDL